MPTNGRIVYAYREEDCDINDLATLTEIAEQAGLDVAAFTIALETRQYCDRIVESAGSIMVGKID